MEDELRQIKEAICELKKSNDETQAILAENAQVQGLLFVQEMKEVFAGTFYEIKLEIHGIKKDNDREHEEFRNRITWLEDRDKTYTWLQRNTYKIISLTFVFILAIFTYLNFIRKNT